MPRCHPPPDGGTLRHVNKSLPGPVSEGSVHGNGSRQPDNWLLRSSYTMRAKYAISDAFVRDCVFAYCPSVAQYVYSLSAENCFRLRNNAISDERVRDCALSTHSVFRPLAIAEPFVTVLAHGNGVYDSSSWCTLVPATLSTYGVGGNPNVNWLTVQLPSINYYLGSISCIRMPSENIVGFKTITIAFQNRMSDNSDFGIVIFITNGSVNDGKLVGMKNTLSSPSRICRDVG